MSDQVLPGYSQEERPMRPVWKHDCDDCIYIGTVSMPDGLRDWYVHRYTGYRAHSETAHSETWIARHGNEGSEYATTVASDPRAVFTTMGTGTKSYSANELIAYALGALGLVPQQQD